MRFFPNPTFFLVIRRRIALDLAELLRRTRAALILQSVIRGAKVRAEFGGVLAREHAVLHLQSAIRRWKVQTIFFEKRKMVVALQARIKGILQRYKIKKSY